MTACRCLPIPLSISMKYILLLCCCLSAGTLEATYHLRYKEFPFASQLPSNEMTGLYQDRTGFIWIGTTNGVSRYDGYRLQNFKNESFHTPGLTQGRITSFAEDSLCIWIGSTQSLTLLHKTSMHPVEHRLQHRPIQALCDDGENTVWIASGQRIYAFQGNENLRDSINLPDSKNRPIQIHSLTYDTKKRLWICSNNGLFVYFTKEKHLKHLPTLGQKNIPITVLHDKKGRIWVTSWGDGLWQLKEEANLQKVAYIRHSIPAASLQGSDSRFFSITEDHSLGYLWALSYNKLHAFQFQEHSGKLQPVELPKEIDTDKMYTQILKDRHGNLWLSSYDQGGIISFTEESLIHYGIPDLNKKIGREPNLLTLNLHETDLCWFIEDRFGLCHYVPTSGKTLCADTIVQGLTIDARVTATSPANGEIWVASPTSPKINRFKVENEKIVLTRTITITPHTTKGNFSQIVEDQKGGLWICFQNRLYHASPKGKVMHTETPQHIDCFCLHPDGSALAVSRDRIFRYYLKGDGLVCHPWGIPLPISEKNARFISLDGTGNAWIATQQGELLHTTNNGKEWKSEAFQQAFQETILLNMLIQGHHIWLVSPYKTIYYDIAFGRMRTFHVKDYAHQTQIFRDQAACITPQGDLFVGGKGGITRIKPLQPPVQQVSSHKIVLTDIQLDGQSLFFGQAEKGHFTDSFHLELDADTEDLSVSISNFTYHIPNKYAFRLEGKDNDWSILDEKENTINIRHLKKGNYHLWIKTTDEWNEWQPEQKLLQITRLPAWYETWWAYLFYGFIGLCFGYLIYHLYRIRIRHRQKKSFKKPDEISLNSLSFPDMDKQFLQQLADCIHEHLSEEGFGIEHLATQLSVSKSTLHRRVKASTGLTPLEFIHNIKLKYACMMLQQGTRTIAEVAYATGFNSPKYFTRCFKDEFNLTPSEYAARHQNKSK